MHPKSRALLHQTNPNHIHNPHDMTKLDLNNSNTEPKSKFGFQEIVILVLMILIVVLAVVAAVIFLNFSFFNSSSTTSSKSSTTAYVSSSVTSTSKTQSASARAFLALFLLVVGLANLQQARQQYHHLVARLQNEVHRVQ